MASTVQRRAGRQQPADERGRAEHVLEVVGDEQQLLGGQEAFDRVARPIRPPAAMISSDVTIAAGTSSGRWTRGERDEVRAVCEVGLDARAASSASRVLPTPPGPVSVSSRTDPSRSRSPIAPTSCSRPIVRFGGAGSAPSPVTAAPRPVGARDFDAGSWTRIGLMELLQLAPGSMPSWSTSTSRACR